MCSAKEELGKLKPTVPEEKATLKRTEEKLQEGTKALTERQKHIKVADRSEFGWATVKYRDDPLASDSDDEKSLNRAEKEARKDTERAASKCRRGAGNGGGARRRRAQYWNDSPAGPSNTGNIRREPFTIGQITGVPQQQRVRELGPCFCCGRPGYIAVNCTTLVGQYPLPQPVVSSAEILKPGSAESSDVYVCNKGVDNVISEPLTHQGGVKMAEAYDLVMSQANVDDQSSPTEFVDSTEAITKYSEVESVQSQITDVQEKFGILERSATCTPTNTELY